MRAGIISKPVSRCDFRCSTTHGRQGRIPDVTLACIKHLRQRSPAVNISVEVEKPGRAGLQELAGEANVVFYSKGWAQAR